MEHIKTEIRQEQIKQAVLDIIYTDGLRNLSTRNIAVRIGMSESTIFRHFTTRQNIILAVMLDIKKDFIDSLRKITSESFDPEIRLYRFLCRTVKYLTKHKGITMLMFSEASHSNNNSLKKNLLQIFNTQKKLFGKIVIDGIALGYWDENVSVDNLAMLYVGIPVSLNTELLLSGAEFHTESFCYSMMQLMLKILKK